MLSNELIIFCNRWLEKASKYTNDTTEDVFDKFFSLFVPYNAIYFDVTLELIENGKIGKKRTGDRVSAVKNIPVYIGQDVLSQKLLDMSDDINKILDLIKNKTFHISTKKDNTTTNTDADKELVDNIEIFLLEHKKKDQQKFNEAVLSLIYGTRCNMFHGKKELFDKQIELLVPMNNILKVIIQDLLLKIDQENTHE
jgi:hypothetical protein